jgi:hypothetical protein
MIMQNRAIASVLIAGLLFGLPGRSEAQSAGNLNGRRQPFNGFDVSNAVIPTSEIRSGGPRREGIPAIDRPSFLRPSQVNYLSDDDLVVSVTLDGKTRAYPLRILVRHEIVNDQVGQSAFVVTYCPLCGTAMVFDRSMGGRTRSFGVSGLLYQSDVLMYDRESESLFSQLAMKAIAGPFVGTSLEWLPSEHMTWGKWRHWGTRAVRDGILVCLAGVLSRNLDMDSVRPTAENSRRKAMRVRFAEMAPQPVAILFYQARRSPALALRKTWMECGARRGLRPRVRRLWRGSEFLRLKSVR